MPLPYEEKIDTSFNTEVENIIRNEDEDCFLISTAKQGFKAKYDS